MVRKATCTTPTANTIITTTGMLTMITITMITATPNAFYATPTTSSGVSVRLERPVDGTRMTRWLNELLADQGPDILRAKGIVNVAGEPRRLVFQAVHMMLEGDLQQPWRADETRESRMVFIGRNLDEAKLRAGVEACAA